MSTPGLCPSPVGVSFHDLLAYNHSEIQRWREWFAKHPEALDVRIGDKIGTVRELVKHIFQAEAWFAALLVGEDPRKLAPDPASDEDELWALHARAYDRLTAFLSSATEQDMQKLVTLPWEGGFDATVRKLLTQACLHNVHHWAQIAMEVRQAGIPSDGPHDILLSKAMR